MNKEKSYHLYDDAYVEGLEKEVKRLKAQIEKMKNCRNCKHFNHAEIHCDFYAHYKCVNLSKWAPCK